MDLIRSVEVIGFRSIKAQKLAKIIGLTALVGKNSSGKSNVLRALNLFFNNEVERGKPLDFSRDYHDQPARRKKSK